VTPSPLRLPLLPALPHRRLALSRQRPRHSLVRSPEGPNCQSYHRRQTSTTRHCAQRTSFVRALVYDRSYSRDATRARSVAAQPSLLLSLSCVGGSIIEWCIWRRELTCELCHVEIHCVPASRKLAVYTCTLVYSVPKKRADKPTRTIAMAAAEGAGRWRW
jgi:hypothetical protein